jgi:hypothetical protein
MVGSRSAPGYFSPSDLADCWSAMGLVQQRGRSVRRRRRRTPRPRAAAQNPFGVLWGGLEEIPREEAFPAYLDSPIRGSPGWSAS